MVFVLGVILFALGITVSIALHEAGHMWTARATGMKVRRFFIGFGPKVFSFRRGETEYGLKAIPAGGFCDIAGMTAIDELEPDEIDRAMYRQKTWKRLVVMLGGIGMNFVLGFLLIFTLAVGWGLPNLNPPTGAMVGEMPCVTPTQNDNLSFPKCVGEGPAFIAGIRQGDVITSVNGTETPEFADVVAATQPLSGTIDFVVERDGKELTFPVQVQRVQRFVSDGTETGRRSETVGAVGVQLERFEPTQYNPLAAIPASVAFTGDMFAETAHRLVQMPSKVADLWTSVTGGARDVDTPISVVGASVIGGQLVERSMWQVFVLLLASLNFFLGIFNLLPLLPLDGGHMAVTIYERIRNFFRNRRGLPNGGPVDYMKLMPVTYVVIVLGGAYMLLTLTADIVNPIQLF
ncbi:site-2 protease family protein [Rhodococcus sp. G-MC3]|uniref:M50 family metallopeptidase n=1 Tax=Rhodococcus sp. G-MC3 TaxID=3046209 RepID=UPI0024BAC89E|nr:site-2 protease family protein [Rhodococcus sp. G-MC3]MDJ0391898.1 site-2 protease family protein [Rhodococcus sp. G-MC3]